MNKEIEKIIFQEMFLNGLATKKGHAMDIQNLYLSMKRSTPSLPLVKTDSAILFEDRDNYLIMYAKNLSGEIVHCLGTDGYPKILKNNH